MRYLAIAAVLLLGVTFQAYAGHISGGEIFYKNIGPGAGANTDKYLITLRLFKDRNDTGPQVAGMPTSVTLTIFRKKGESSYEQAFNLFPVDRVKLEEIAITPAAYPCILPTPNIRYQIGYYEETVDLPREAFGYLVAFQTCCRANNITNMLGFSLPSGTLGDGATYVANISGTNLLGSETNSSPEFKVKDTAIVCADNRFELDFGAVDPNLTDSLSYSFKSAYNRGTATGAQANHIASSPPFENISYTAGFSGTQPLGSNVTIDPVSGLITGTAPAPGKYVINVYIDEFRRGQRIGEHRKDFILEVKSCNIAGADLKPGYITCDGFNLRFENLSNSPLVTSWYWDFGITGTDTDVSTSETPDFTFPVAGDYNVKLVVNRNQQCSDSITTIAKVYPGFFPGFFPQGSCILNDFNFIDTSKTAFGTISKWTWNFGDETTSGDVSNAQNPSWKYSTTGIKTIECIIESSKGCIDTIKTTTEVRDKPVIDLPFRDTLICSVDTLQLLAGGFGTYSWSPAQPVIARLTNTASPEVYPKATTVFKVTLDDNGCVNTDSIRVRVVDFVTLDAGPDKTICLTDPVTLVPSGDGLYFEWTPAATLDDSSKRNPVATPTEASTTYRVLASISDKCSAEDVVNVRAVPYPDADAGNDVTICYDDTTQLTASIVGISFTWSPVNTLINGATLTPLARPLTTTRYVLSVLDNKGCPKPGTDTVVVTVRPEIFARAGNDTSVVINQPLLFNGSGADFYEWSPATGLSRTDVNNPTARLTENITYIMKAYTAENCFDYDTVNVKVFKTLPDIFVPNAFTPGRSSNAFFRPIPVGISRIEFFRVFNRWGQIVYSSIDQFSGWDGKIGGREQPQGTYVWMVKGTDFTGKPVVKKGTVVLIR
ncbi:MAG: gliding motility-associated C-terminal domain-containing protein [Chitinophagaceae bacterium]|nr:gliding motility-associated C-terminal domain-containing protein [Chitinophagaceae bacterium]